jgi:hypothetical protein
MSRDAENLSTRYQPKGSGTHPSDTLDRGGERPFGDKGDSATARIDDQGRPQPDEDAAPEQRPAEGGDDLPPPTEGSPEKE